MHRFWDVLIRPVLDAVQPRLLVEIGAGQGATTRPLLEFCAESGAVLHSIDPAPAFDIAAFGTEFGEQFVFHRARSLNVLSKIETPDLVLIDGDHNWYTVHHELQLLEKRAARDARAYPVCLVHDVDWPYGRRDLYYDPDSIPPAFQQPHERKAIWPGEAELQDEGLNAHLLNAVYEHDVRNGVLTAVEDFMEESSESYVLGRVGGLHGVGVLASARTLAESAPLRSLLSQLRSPEFLEARIEQIETARLLADIERNRALAAHHGKKERLAELEGELERARDAAEQLASIEAQRTALEQRLQESRDELLAAEGRIAELAKLHSQISDLAERQAEQLDQGNRARKKLERALADAREAVQERENEAARLSEAGELASRERLRVERELGRLRAELEARGQDRAQLRERIAALQRDLTDLQSVHQTKLAEAARDRTARESALEQVRREQAGKQAALRAAESARAARDAAQQETERERLERQAASTEAARERLARDWAIQQAEEERRAREILQADLERGRSALEEAKSETQRASTDRDAALDMLREAAQKEAEAAKAREAVALERSRLAEEITALEKRADEVRKRHEAEQAAAEERLSRQARDRQRLATMLDERNRQLAKAEREVTRRDDQLRAIATSRSWRWGNRLVRALRILTFRRVKRPDFGVELLTGEAPLPLPAPDTAAATFPPPGRTEVSVDVIVCVRDALEDVRGCLTSLYSKTERDFGLILVDDGSAPATRDFLVRFADTAPGARLLRRDDEPHGFALAANDGLRVSDADYLVFLNSDTEVTFGWLEQIVECGESDSRIGIIGPLSNAASHQSVPHAKDGDDWAVNELPAWLPADGVSLLAPYSAGFDSPRVPTVNGFCYAAKREVVAAIGEFDDELFPDGYGAEDDYTYRAHQVGFEAALAVQAYVYHSKSRSFGPSARAELATVARRNLAGKHGEDAVSALTEANDRPEQLGRLRGVLDTASRSPAAAADAVASAEKPAMAVLYVVQGVTHIGAEAVSVAYYSACALRLLGVDARVAVTEDIVRSADRYYPPSGELFCALDQVEGLSWATTDAGFLIGVGGDARTGVATSRLQWRTVLVGEVVGFPQQRDLTATGAAVALTYSWAGPSIDGGERVLRVEPGVDESLFQPRRRDAPEPRLVVRLPEIDPGDALTKLDLLASRLGVGCEIASFGCQHDRLGPPGDLARVRQLGVLGPSQRARLLAGAQLFVDLRGGTALPQGTLEAMACGCVPVGAEAADEVAEAVEALLADPMALTERANQARQVAEEFPLLRAGLSECALLQHVRARSERTPAAT